MGALSSLILKMGVDLSDVKSAGTEIKQILSSALASAQTVESTVKASTLSQADAVDIAKQAIAAENQRTAEFKAQLSELEKQTAEYSKAAQESQAGAAASQAKRAAIEAETAQISKNLAALQLETAELQKQAAAHRNINQERAGGGGREGGGGGGSSVLGKAAGAVFGKGLAGSIAGGVLAGEGIEHVVDAGVEGIARFIDKLKEMQDDASKFTLINDVFERLAQAAGVDAAGALEKMREATEGLVDKMTLLRTATAALKSPFGITFDQITQVEGAVVKLAEANGNTAQQAITALNQALTTGYTRQLSYITGLSRTAGQLDNVSSSAGRLERGTLTLQKSFAMMIAEADKISPLPQTLEQMTTRLSVAWTDLLRDFGRGFNLSAGLQAGITEFDSFAKEINGQSDNITAVGQHIGDSFLVIGVAVKSAIPAVQALWESFKEYFGIESTLSKAVLGIQDLKEDANDTTVVFQQMHPVLDSIIQGVIGLNLQVEILAIKARAALAPIKEIADSVKDKASPGTSAIALGEAGFRFMGQHVNLGIGTAAQQNQNTGRSSAEYPASFVGPVPAGASHAKPTTDEQIQAATDKARATYQDTIDAYNKAQDALNKAKPGVTPAKPTDQARLGDILKQAQLEMQGKLAIAKEELANKQADLAREKEMDQQFYEDGKLAATEYFADLQDIENRGWQARKELEKTNLAAELVELHASYNARRSQEGAHPELLNAEEAKEVATKTTVSRTKQTELDRQHSQNTSNITRDVNKDKTAALAKQYEDELQLTTKHIADMAALQQKGVQSNQKITEEQFKNGELSPDTYLKKRVDGVTQLAQIEIEAAQHTAQAQKDAAQKIYDQTKELNARAQSELTGAIAKASQTMADSIEKNVATAEAALNELKQNEGQIRQGAIERKYAPQIESTQNQISFTQSQPNADSSGQITTLLAQIKAEREEYEQLINSPAVAQGSDQWYQLYQKIEQTWEMQKKYNDELERMRNYQIIAGQSLGSIGQNIGDVFHSKFGQNLAQSVQSGAKTLETAPDTFKQIFHKQTTTIDPATAALESKASAIMDASKTSFDAGATTFNTLVTSAQTVIAAFQQLALAATSAANSVKGGSSGVGNSMPDGYGYTGNGGYDDTDDSGDDSGVGNSMPDGYGYTGAGSAGNSSDGTGASYASGGAASSLGQFSKSLTAAIGAVGGFVSTLTNAKSPIAGALGGALGGAGIGGQIGGMFGPLGQLIGTGVGLLGGGIAGAITGGKNQEVANNISTLQTNFTKIMNQFSDNTNNLNQTVLAISGLMAQAEAEQASSKKGGSQYQQLITQYTQQIQQLQAQQIQLAITVNETLASANAPLADQSFLNDLTTIFKNFQQYAGAASNVQDLANAYQYLNSAVANYAATSAQQLNQDNLQAIQDALQLNDLIYQQSQLTLQYNDQVQSILSAGVLTRTPTRAQTAAQQVQTLQANYDRQMQDMNAQISTETFKVNAESQIFNLATTRIGLENQLVTVQNQQTTYDMQRISALSQLVTALSTGNYSLLPGLAALINSLPQVSTYDGGTAVPPLTGNPTSNPYGTAPVTGTARQSTLPVQVNHLENQFAAAYQDRAALGYASYRSTNLL